MPKFVLLLVMIATMGMIVDDGPKHVTVVAKAGDGAYPILRRYHLLDQSANLQRFYELNNLKSNQGLFEGRQYKLPVMIYQYDGTSIRSTIGIDDWDKAKRIAEYNSRIYHAGLTAAPYNESMDLWVPMHELVASPSGSTAATPVATEVTDKRKMVNIELFGPDYSEVEVVSNMLDGQAFYVISGHGGPDPGAMSEANGHTLCEDEYAYDVTLRLARKLIEHGATVEVVVQDPNDGIRDDVLLTCDKTELSMGEQQIPLRQLTRLKQRVYAVNRKYAEHKKDGIKQHTVVCIHVDSRSPNRRQDVFFYYYEPSKRGKELANQLQDTFRDKYERYRPGRGYHGTVSSRGLYVLRHTDPPAVYVELANIRNASDLQRILPKDNRQALANWLFEGLVK